MWPSWRWQKCKVVSSVKSSSLTHLFRPKWSNSCTTWTSLYPCGRLAAASRSSIVKKSVNLERDRANVFCKPDDGEQVARQLRNLIHASKCTFLGVMLIFYLYGNVVLTQLAPRRRPQDTHLPERFSRSSSCTVLSTPCAASHRSRPATI